jgi:hypothetical protein
VINPGRWTGRIGWIPFIEWGHGMEEGLTRRLLSDKPDWFVWYCTLSLVSDQGMLGKSWT